MFQARIIGHFAGRALRSETDKSTDTQVVIFTLEL